MAIFIDISLCPAQYWVDLTILSREGLKAVLAAWRRCNFASQVFYYFSGRSGYGILRKKVQVLPRLQRPGITLE
ncbi:hypothetical protein A4R35_16995 [Thermogemmatispora tikiterensis]|uniref:Uncharacterized protein n=1 Tax=Thermogemmatispora tikiterensis TaxID=1825093 RepID=A0A328VH19_9CHLR|nr:hypothetical protein A4R35_16995 [Thermogemmatispora tikiterensis]